ncbi:MAG TPA: universal stress protein [Ilumatobacteraceae bacterium]|nr:universal stress protein [Ilumatobacteraceae bacterium]
MYATIVVGTDGSSTAEKAVAHAAQLAALSGARLHIATVAPRIPVLVAPDMVVASAEWNEASDQSTQLALAGAAQIAENAGAAATTHALGGEPADALLSLCDDVDADLLVVGNRGMQGARRFLLGSVSSRCAHHADCSVLIVQTT